MKKKFGNIEIINSDCIDTLKIFKTQGKLFDAIITDPPYSLNLYKIAWDNTGIAFSSELWSLLFDVLKPGGFIAAFAASRLYHRVACAGEDAGFKVYPMMNWVFDGGLPKPINLSELFDREVKDRKNSGEKKTSGYTTASVFHGAQNRTKTVFEIKERYLTEDSVKWKGYYYGVNCMKPVMEPIFLGQKPPLDRMVDNIKEYGVGALNLGAIQEQTGFWATPFLHHKKARKYDHQSDHPSVKPVSLMEDLCRLLCPPGGLILDVFGGTGSTGLAAAKNGFDSVLIEQNPEMIPVIERRYAELKDKENPFNFEEENE
jgi:site-specific DNA-methyltransferase (adenine-specific)